MIAVSTDVRRQVAEAVYALGAAVVRRIPRDVSLTSISTLATLDRTGPRRLTDLAATQGVSQPSMTSLVAGLERAGLVERRSDAGDRRVARIALTPGGAEALRRRRRVGTDSVVELVDLLTAEELEVLLAAVPVLRRLGSLDQEQRESE